MIFKFYQIFRSIKEVVGIEKAKQVFPEYEKLPDKMLPEEQAELARIIMTRLDRTFDKDTILRIRMKHPCGIPKKDNESILLIKNSYKSAEERIGAYSTYLQGKYNCISNNEYIFTWGNRFCECGMFRKLSSYVPISPTWCQCCNANNKMQFEFLLDRNITSELLEGICCGGKNCSFKIKF